MYKLSCGCLDRETITGPLAVWSTVTVANSPMPSLLNFRDASHKFAIAFGVEVDNYNLESKINNKEIVAESYEIRGSDHKSLFMAQEVHCFTLCEKH